MSSPSDHPADISLARSGGGVARSVAEDLEAIFPRPAEGARPGRRTRLGRRGPRTSRVISGGKAAGWGAVIAAALVGVSAGSLLSRTRAPAAANLPAERPVAVAALAPAPALTPEPAPALPTPGPIIPSTPLPASAPAKALEASAEPARRPAAAPRKAAAARAAKPAQPKAIKTACGGSRCTHSDVLAADRRLRRAYSAAIRAGVSRSVLVDYRNRWARLRHRAPREPALVVARYSAMARDLNRFASRQSASYSDGSWRSLRRDVSTGGR